MRAMAAWFTTPQLVVMKGTVGTSYMSSLGLRNPKNRNACKLTKDFNHCSSKSASHG